MTTDGTFQYPPDLFNLLEKTIPLLCPKKNDVLLFFRGAGVSDSMTKDLADRLKITPKEINKYEIARVTLERLNARGDRTLRERREVLRRVVEFENYESCWPDDQIKAKGFVASVRD